MASFTDQLNRKIEITFPPNRIISLVPSQTELLCDFGLREEVVGITKFCVHPQEWFSTKTRVGGTKKIDFEKIKSLNPDLIIGNKEENDELQIKGLMGMYPVWMSDIKNFADALQMIESVGDLVDREDAAKNIMNSIASEFVKLKSHITSLNSQMSGAYLIWNDPIMTVGRDTFIHDMMMHCGFKNVFENKSRYPEITLDELQEAKPQLILLSSEPFPFKEKHVELFKKSVPQSKVILVDGEMFSWYGSRLMKAPDYFIKLIEDIKNAS